MQRIDCNPVYSKNFTINYLKKSRAMTRTDKKGDQHIIVNRHLIL